MVNQVNNSKVLNVLIGVSLVVNIGYMGMKLIRMYKESKQKCTCGCQDRKG